MYILAIIDSELLPLERSLVRSHRTCCNLVYRILIWGLLPAACAADQGSVPEALMSRSQVCGCSLCLRLVSILSLSLSSFFLLAFLFTLVFLSPYLFIRLLSLLFFSTFWCFCYLISGGENMKLVLRLFHFIQSCTILSVNRCSLQVCWNDFSFYFFFFFFISLSFFST